MVHNLIIFDTEEEYAKSFANYVNMQKSFPFEVRYFCNIDNLRAYSARNEIDIILVAENLQNEVANEKCHLLIKLTDDNTGNVSYDKSVYKYQSCEQIIRYILMLVAESPEINKLSIRKNEMKILGFYSPVKSAGQTQLAINIGLLLSLDFRVLYINLEGNSGIEDIFGINFSIDLSDLLYDIKNGNKDVAATIGGNVYNLDGLDVFPIMRDFRDLAGMSFEEWRKLLRKLETDTNYDYIVLDISDFVQGICELLSICNYIFMPEKDDRVSVAKKRQFLSGLKSEYQNGILDKLIECKVPVIANTNVIYEKNSVVGEYGRQLLAEAGIK